MIRNREIGFFDPLWYWQDESLTDGNECSTEDHYLINLCPRLLYYLYYLYSRLRVLHEAAPVIVVLTPAVGHLLLLDRVLPAPAERMQI